MKLCGKSGGNPKDIVKSIVDNLNLKEYEEITQFTCDNAFICVHLKSDFELAERVHLSLK
jgi:arginyl-tRNA synthetase